MSNDTVKRTAEYYEWATKNNFENCEDCAMAKSRQANMNKERVERAKERGERLFVDISSTEHESFGKARFWLLIVDDATDYCWSYFLRSKSELGKTVIDLIDELHEQEGIRVRKIRCDNAGENKTLQTMAKERKLGIVFEYTARNTPQQNGRVERKFATLFNRVRAMLNGAGFTNDYAYLRKGLWAEAVAVATKMENVIVTTNKEVPAFERFFERSAPYIDNLRIFREVGIIFEGTKIKSKLENRGIETIFVGYADNHGQGVYCMLNLKT